MSKSKLTLEKLHSIKYRMIFDGIIIGIITGFVVSLFRVAIEKGEIFNKWLIKPLSQGVFDIKNIFIYIFFISIASFIIWFCGKYIPLSKGSGIPQVKGEIRGQINHPWYKVIISKIIGGTTAISAGLSLGREGPSIQIGAMIGKGLSKIINRLPVEEKMMMTSGAGAGLAAAFNAPLAGVVFALEELHNNFSTNILLATMSSAVSANIISSYIFGLNTVFDLPITDPLPLSYYWILIILGIILGISGTIYNSLMMKTLNLFKKINSPIISIGAVMIITCLLSILMPQVLGSGHHLVGEIARGMNPLEKGNGILSTSLLYLGAGSEGIVISLFVLLLIKFIFSSLSFGSGSPGGIFLPLLVLGSILGGLIGQILLPCLELNNDFISKFVILGMTGLFASIVKAPITGVILITEMTGNFKNFLPLTTVALISYLVSDLLKGEAIYDLLLNRSLNDNSIPKEAKISDSRKVLLECDIYMGSFIDGRKLVDLGLPQGCLVVSITRNNVEMVPWGTLTLKAGDKLIVLCGEAYANEILEEIDKKCKKIKI